MRLSIFAVVPVVVGCATGDLPPRGTSDPANPAAREGFRFAIEASPTDATPAQPEAGTLYTCPMHPEVVQDHPGTCPKCGMTLKPKP